MILFPVFPVDGVPVFGTYVAEQIVDLEAMRDIGMNVVLGGHRHLDIATPEGKYCAENGIKVMHHLTGHIYGRPKLRDAIGANERTIPLAPAAYGALPPQGLIQLDDELIRYGSTGDRELRDCVRGVDGTAPASHRGGMFVFWPEEAAAEIREAKESPNLWGYYVLDDSPGDAISALRALYRTVKRLDPGRPVGAGFGSAGSLCNFGPDVCDVMLIYWYPVDGDGEYHRMLTSEQVQWMVAEARSQVPGMPFFGIYQTFNAATVDNPDATGTPPSSPTAAQLREQLEDFVREGASGLIAFLCNTGGRNGWALRSDYRDVLREVHSEIRETGGLTLAPEPPEMRAARVQPVGYWREPDSVPGIPRAWHVVAPFADPDGTAFDAGLPPETAIDLDAVYGGNEGPIRWVARRTIGGVVGFGEIVGSGNKPGSIAYATCTVTSPQRIEAQLRFGSDDDAVVWLNGKDIHRHTGSRGVNRDEDVVDVILPQGESRILVKVRNRAGMWGFAARFTNRDGRPLDGLLFEPAEWDGK